MNEERFEFREHFRWKKICEDAERIMTKKST
jgi:hypothetical protein